MCFGMRPIHHIHIVICPFRLAIMCRELFCGWSIAIPAAMHFGTPLAAEGQGFLAKGWGKACHGAFLH